MLILTQFVLRLSFGLALAMGITSPRKVTSGYFRNHAYVLLGLNVLATLAALANPKELLLWPPLAGAILSYLCAVAWLYERRRLGIALLIAIAWTSVVGFGESLIANAPDFQSAPLLHVALARPGPLPSTILHLVGDVVVWEWGPMVGAILIGSTLAAMFLGHWYLNSPTMELAPLKRLIRLMTAAVIARAIFCFAALVLLLSAGFELSTLQIAMIVMRWTAGILGTLVLIWMTWETLKIPNTQSATGLLYVAVLATFLGELTSLLLSAGTGYPL